MKKSENFHDIHAWSSSVGMAVWLSMACLGLTGCFNVSTETETLRNSLVKSIGADCEPEIEIGIGAMTLSLARTGLSFLDLDDDALAAFRAVRNGDVGIYHLRPREKPFHRAQMLLSADKAMSGLGWDRVVGVVNAQELVAVYSPQGTRSGKDVRLCVVVLEGTKLILVSARSNVEALLDLALKRGNGRFPISLQASSKSAL